MIIIDHAQGTEGWKAHRKTTHNASDYPVAQGLSKTRSRSKLVREAATGIEPEFTDWQEKILANGHRVEELARPMAEMIIGEDLYPLVATSDDGYLGASSDGATMLMDKGWECKQWNAELAESVANGIVPKTHVGQLDQQGEVFGFESILFMVTDGTPENCVYCWYYPSAEAKAAIRPVWKQFDEDVRNYQPEVIEAKPILTANPINNLPALVVEVTGRVTHSNLVEFKAAANAVISSIKTELVTDQDFVDASAAVKYLKDVEDNAKRAKQNALDQTTSIAELHRALDEVAKMAGDVRKALDKKITEEKDRRKEDIVRAGADAMGDYWRALNDRIGGYMPPFESNFGGAVKGLKSLDSMREKVDAELARCKIATSEIADRIEYNIKTLEGEGFDWRFLFPDLASVCAKAKDDFTALLMSRVSQHKEKEAKRLEAERERIRQEEIARINAEQETAAAKARLEAEKAQREAEELARRNAQAVASNQPQIEKPAACVEEKPKSETQPALSIASEQQPAAIADEIPQPVLGARIALPADACLPKIKLGEICTRLGYTVSAEFLASLGFEATTEKNAKLYNEASFLAICRRISDHTLRVGMTTKLAA